MIEKIVLDYLQKNKIAAYLEENEEMPEEYVLIEKAGSGGTRHIKKATIIIQSYSVTLYKTMLLNEKVKRILEKLAELDDICRCELNSDYNYTDTKRKKYRYQAVFDIVHY
ncbi:MAG: hypothetical protein KH034_02700 [Lachnospiraceae bacterium]|nr:hypothetical protein [Lachnospiraceae bacterium]